MRRDWRQWDRREYTATSTTCTAAVDTDWQPTTTHTPRRWLSDARLHCRYCRPSTGSSWNPRRRRGRSCRCRRPADGCRRRAARDVDRDGRAASDSGQATDTTDLEHRRRRSRCEEDEPGWTFYVDVRLPCTRSTIAFEMMFLVYISPMVLHCHVKSWTLLYCFSDRQTDLNYCIIVLYACTGTCIFVVLYFF